MSRFTTGFVQNYLNNLDPPQAGSGGGGGGPPTGPAGGDLTGTYPNPLLKNVASAGVYGNASTALQVTLNSKGLVTSINPLPIVFPSSLPPNGPAGGDLFGTYPNPNLVSIVTAGSVGSATQVGQFTFDAKGRVTSASNVTISAPPAGAAGGDLTGIYPNPTLIASGVLAGTYGTSVTVPQFTVDSKGRITSASDVSITFPPPSNVIMDDGPVVIGARYPTQPSVEGCWYGYNTKQYTVADSVVLGNNCRGAFSGAVAVGKNCEANSAGSISIGENTVNGISSTAVGLFNSPLGDQCYIFGTLNTTSSANNYALGLRNTVTGQEGSTAIGSRNTQTNTGLNLAFGYLNETDCVGGNCAIAMGLFCKANFTDVCIGEVAQSTGNRNICIGYNVRGNGLEGIALGSDAVTTGILATSIGVQASSYNYGVALGVQCQANLDRAVAIGYQTAVNNIDSIGVGTGCAVSGGSSSCFGLGTNDGGVSASTCLGAGAQTVSPSYALSFGLNSQSVFSNALNLRLNNSDRQIEAFTKLYQTFVSANGVDVQLSYTGANSSKTSFFTGIWNTDVLLPLATAGYLGYEIVIVNKSSADLNIYADPGKTSLVGSLASQQWGFITVIDTVADVAASWSFQVGSGPIVMDNIASSSQFPTAPQSQGCWYGTGSKIACGANGVCIGNGVGGNGNISPESITIGYQANANSPAGSAPSIAIGVRATCGTGNNPIESNIAIGYEAACFGYPTTGSSSIAFGRSAAGLFGGMAFGNNSVAIFDSVAMGIGATCQGNANASIAFGTGALVDNINNGIALGAGAQVTSPFYALSIAVNSNTFGTFYTNVLLNNNVRQIEAYSALYRTVVTSAGVENISFSDAKKIYFTGTATHDIVLPNATAGVVGFEVKIVNNSTGALTIWADFTGGSLVTVLPGANPGVTRGGWGFFNLIDTAAQVAASWSAELGTTMI